MTHCNACNEKILKLDIEECTNCLGTFCDRHIHSIVNENLNNPLFCKECFIQKYKFI